MLSLELTPAWLTAGWTGKTRLAVQAARVAEPGFPGGVTFVSLASATSITEAFDAVADAVRIDGPGRGMVDRWLVLIARGSRGLAGQCRTDPGRHVRWPSRLFTSDGAPRPSVTSRVPVGLPGEVVRVVAPLSESDASPGSAERARETVPDFVPDRAEVRFAHC